MILKNLTYTLLIFTTITYARPPQPDKTSTTSTQELIQLILAEDLNSRKFAFPDVIHATTGKKILPLDHQNPTHQLITQAIHQATKETNIELSRADSPIQKLRRINEASRYFEDRIIKKLNLHPNLKCSPPTNSKGNQQRSGYPDIHITHTATDGTITHAYLDPKLFEKKSRTSTLRSFYYEPRTHTNKIQHHALHLLIGISHNGIKGQWQFSSPELCDLSHFHVRLKAEFQASNRDLYSKPTLISPKN